MTQEFKIPLTGKHGCGKYVLVDEEDYERLKPYPWNLQCDRVIKGRVNGHKVIISRFVMNAQPHHRVAVLGDYLDMRKENLNMTGGATDTERKCTKCRVVKTIANFYRNGDTYGAMCKACVYIQDKTRTEEYRARPDDEVRRAQEEYKLTHTSKICCDCKEDLPFERFSTVKCHKYGYSPQCTLCINKALEKVRLKLLNRTDEELLLDRPIGPVICPYCRVPRSVRDFEVCKANRNGLRVNCRDCRLSQSSLRYNQLKQRSDEEINSIRTIGPLPCTKCHIPKAVMDFVQCRGRTSGLESFCRDCELAKKADYRHQKRELIRELKEGMSCDECGFDDIRCLQFAHFDRESKARDGSGRTICLPALGIAGIINELEEVRMLCAICHAHETAVENKANLVHTKNAIDSRNYRDHLYELVNNEKWFRGECIDCGLGVTEGAYYIFDFDHRPGEIKITEVSRMICNLDSEETICDEMDKCDLRCKHCHIIVTAERLKASDSS